VSSTLGGRVSPTTAKSREDTEPPVVPTVPEGGAPPLEPLLELLLPLELPEVPLDETLPELAPLDPPELPPSEPPLLLPPDPPHTSPRGTQALTLWPFEVLSVVHAWSDGQVPSDEHEAAQ
jgi:hypothetical protein